ncbi:MAG: SAM-dependent methyltransferase [bacterium]|nr:SAM-dependent methyltransferase [bacterium]
MEKKFKSQSTPQLVAMIRTMHYKMKNKYFKGNDYLAEKFLNKKFTIMMKLPFLRWLINYFYTRLLPGGAEFILGRDKYFDKLLEENMGKCEQLVILGAGFDTRSLRFGELMKNGTIFELDHPEISAMKIEKVKKIAGELPKNLIFVPIDFDSESLKEKLEEAGCDKTKKTLFFWEGVTYYLEPESVDEVMLYISGTYPQGSLLIFDYLYKELITNPGDFFGAPEFIEVVKKKNEPVLFGIPRGKGPEYLEKWGYRQVSAYESETMNKENYTMPNGTPVGRSYEFMVFVLAEVK